MGSARSLQCEWILGETTDLHCFGLPLEMLAVLRNFFTENCGLVGVGRGNGYLPRMFASLECWENQPPQFWVMGRSFSTNGGAYMCQLLCRVLFRC